MNEILQLIEENSKLNGDRFSELESENLSLSTQSSSLKTSLQQRQLKAQQLESQISSLKEREDQLEKHFNLSFSEVQEKLGSYRQEISEGLDSCYQNEQQISNL